MSSKTKSEKSTKCIGDQLFKVDDRITWLSTDLKDKASEAVLVFFDVNVAKPAELKVNNFAVTF